MFEGSEGPERAAEGRHEQRQTRQVLSAFLALFSQNPAPRRRRGSNGSAETGVAGGRLPAHSWTPRTANEAPHPEGGDLAGAGVITAPRMRSPWTATDRVTAG